MFGQIAITSKEVSVSHVPLPRVVAWLARVNRALTTAIEGPGEIVPIEDASVVRGDDDLPWPPERRRERLWQVPALDMVDWPTEEMPDDVSDLLRQRFQRLRECDGVD